MRQPLIINGIDFNERLDDLRDKIDFNTECIFARDTAKEYIVLKSKGMKMPIMRWKWFIGGPITP
jgi:hypothetical protein